MQRRTVPDSPIGSLTIEANARGEITGLSMAGWYRQIGADVPEDQSELAIFDEATSQLEAYFAGSLKTFHLPLAPEGNAFHQTVWHLLREIPYGETWSYGELAARLGDRSLARAVGSACGANPIALIIPCHRVIGADGSLTGFGGGLENKEFLLHLENPANVPLKPRLFV